MGCRLSAFAERRWWRVERDSWVEKIFGSSFEAKASKAFQLALKSCRVEVKRCEQMNLLGRFTSTRHEPKIKRRLLKIGQNSFVFDEFLSTL
jgi:hypothetical protein